MNSPLISVVMPTLNSETYVAKAVESILSQTFADFEFLILNEYGSNDATVDIINKFNDSRIRVMQNKKKLGIAESLNEGIRQAKGKYIARMDSDDISVPERFERQITFMENNPDIAICGGWAQFFGENKAIHKTPATHEEIRISLIFSCDMVHPSTMLRREDIVNKNLWYNPTYLAEDYELWLRAVQIIKFANLQEVLVLYRCGENNRTVNIRLRIIEQVQEFYEKAFMSLGINYKKDYPANLLGAWFGNMYGIPQTEWRERMDELTKLFNNTLEHNRQVKLYDEKILSRYLYRQYLRSFDIADSHISENPILPAEYLIDDILNKLTDVVGENRLCVYGLGKIGSRVLQYFKRHFGNRLICVSDSDKKKWGKDYEGLECIPPDNLERELCIVVTAGYEGIIDITADLTRKGFQLVIPYIASPFSIHNEENIKYD